MHPAIDRIKHQPRIEQRSGQWFKTRGKLLTASDCAAALGILPFESFRGDPKDELVRRKAEQALGITTFIGNVATQHGQAYEQEALDRYAAETGSTVMDFGLLIHPDHDWLGGSPDGITSSGILLEVKCPYQRKIGDGRLPAHYMPQVQVCLEICDLDEAHFIQYRPEILTWPLPPEFVITKVARDRQWFADALPTLKVVHDEIQLARSWAVSAGELPYPPVPKAPRQRRVKPKVACLIDDTLYGLPTFEDTATTCLFS